MRICIESFDLLLNHNHYVSVLTFFRVNRFHSKEGWVLGRLRLSTVLHRLTLLTKCLPPAGTDVISCTRRLPQAIWHTSQSFKILLRMRLIATLPAITILRTISWPSKIFGWAYSFVCERCIERRETRIKGGGRIDSLRWFRRVIIGRRLSHWKIPFCPIDIVFFWVIRLLRINFKCDSTTFCP